MKAPYLLLLLSALLIAGANAQEQNTGRVELFAGFSYVNYPVFAIYSGPWSRNGFNGWEASAAYKGGTHWGLVADFGGGSITGSSESNSSLRTYMGGPRVFADFGKASVYGHVLFGGLTFDRGFPNDSGTTFAVGIGGGVNYWLGRHFGVRLVQVDYLHNTNSAASAGIAVGGAQPSADLRVSTGVAFRFGN